MFGGTWTRQPLRAADQRRAARGPRLPVTRVTGFLGSGKTTLIRALLDQARRGQHRGRRQRVRRNRHRRRAVAVEQRRDRAARQWLPVLQRPHRSAGDLAQACSPIAARGAVPSFERVVIETSGLADPGPVLQTFATDRALGDEFHLQALDRGRRCAGRRRQSRPDARGETAGGARRPHRRDQERSRRRCHEPAR